MLSLAFLLHCCLSSGVGVLMLFFPDDLRDYFWLAQSLSGIVGVFLVAQAFLSHTAKTLRDPNARRGIAWALAMQHAMLAMYIAKDVSMHIYNDAAWIVIASLTLMSAAFVILIHQGDPEYAELRLRSHV